MYGCDDAIQQISAYRNLSALERDSPGVSNSGLPPTYARGHRPDGPKADNALTSNLDR